MLFPQHVLQLFSVVITLDFGSCCVCPLNTFACGLQFNLESPDYDSIIKQCSFFILVSLGNSIHGFSKLHKSSLFSYRVDGVEVCELQTIVFAQGKLLEAYSQQMQGTVNALRELVHAEFHPASLKQKRGRACTFFTGLTETLQNNLAQKEYQFAFSCLFNS